MPNLSTLNLPSGPSIPVKGVSTPLRPAQKAFSLSETGRVNQTDAAKEQIAQETPVKFTFAELGQQLKQAKPGIFDAFTDEEVGQKAVERRPELAPHVVQPEEKSGFIANMIKGLAKTPLRVAATGLGLGKTLLGMDTLEQNPNADRYGMDAQGNYVGQQTNAPMALPFFGNIQPLGYNEQGQQKTLGGQAMDALGAGLELGSYFIGAGEAAGLAKGAATGVAKATAKGVAEQGLKGLAIQGAKESAAIGATGALGSGLQDENATVGQLAGQTALGGLLGLGLGLATPLAGKAAGKTWEGGKALSGKVWDRLKGQSFDGIKGIDQASGNVIERLGKKIQTTVIKPTKKDIQGGFRIDNVQKYDLGGNLNVAYEKTQQRLDEYAAELKKIIDQGGDAQVVNMGKLVDELENANKGKGLASLGSQRETNSTIEGIKKELETIDPNWRDNNINLSDAIQAKRAIGQYTAFLHDPIKPVQSAAEKVWNDFYILLKNETERVAPPGLREVNKAISEIIPIQQAIIRRIPVAERNNVLGMADLIGGTGMFISPGAIAVPLAQRLLKSGTFADWLMKMGKNATPLAEKAAAKTAQEETAPVAQGVVRALESAKGNVKLQSKTLKPSVDPLIAEAKKYKSAEEFADSIITAKRGETYQKASHLVKELPIESFGTFGKEGSEIFQVHQSTDARGIEQYIKRIESGERPPVVAGSRGFGYPSVRDGHHRLEAYRKLGFKNVPTLTTQSLEDIWNKANKKK